MHPIENIMRTSMEQIKEIIDVNTIVGTPISIGTEGMILPVSKVSLGFLSGGGEYGTKNRVRQASRQLDTEEDRYPFAGAAAAGMSLTPVGFLSVNGENVRVLPVSYDCYMDRVVDAIPALINVIAESCSKNKNAGDTDCGCKTPGDQE